MSTVGRGSNVVGKYLAFVLISLEEQMDDIDEEDQKRVNHSEINASALQKVVSGSFVWNRFHFHQLNCNVFISLYRPEVVIDVF